MANLNSRATGAVHEVQFLENAVAKNMTGATAPMIVFWDTRQTRVEAAGTWAAIATGRLQWTQTYKLAAGTWYIAAEATLSGAIISTTRRQFTVEP